MNSEPALNTSPIKSGDHVREIPLLLIGDGSLPDFNRISGQLGMLAATRNCPSLSAAESILQVAIFEPELIFILQAYPGEFSSEALNAINRQAPLARIVIVQGSWAEGDLRSGKPTTGHVRIAAENWPAWWDLQQARLAAGKLPDWAMPITMPPEEQAWNSAEHFMLDTSQPITIAIRARDVATEQGLIEACHSFGARTTLFSEHTETANHDPTSKYDLLLWSLRSSELDSLADSSTDWPRTKWIALFDFPRPADIKRLLQHGALAVLSQPFHLSELFSILQSQIET